VIEEGITCAQRGYQKEGIPRRALPEREALLFGRRTAHERYDHDSPYLAEGKLVPHGIYDLQANTGFVTHRDER